MSLKERITEDMKAAMRARQAERLSAIRMLLAAIKQREVDSRAEADDAAVVAIVEKLIKQRRDSIAQFEAGGRSDLVAREGAEVKVLAEYLPQQMSEAQVGAAIEAAIAEAGATGPAAMGKVMGLLKARLAGRADIGRVSAEVRKRLAG
ncbi:MAG: GatB/YqeY domain-containing protein [Burkholderiales bacterium]|jgi:uncharacterized protein YqeY|nr:MAG: GatB/YqeY domain-containing protein [Burkholderiales bacterium]